MKVFISWSGPTGKEIADTLYKWFGTLLPDELELWVSDRIEFGSLWATELFQQLKHTHYGIVCLTPDNVESDWMLFEAGALAKMFDESKKGRVVPLLYGVSRDQLPSPYRQFQSAAFKRDTILRLLKELNGALEHPKSEEKLERLFDSAWPEIDKALGSGVTQLLSEHPEEAYEFYARRYGVGHAEVVFRGTISADGKFKIERQISVEAFSETKSLDTFLHFPEGVEQERQSKLANAEIAPLEVNRHITLRSRDVEPHRSATEITFEPPLQPGEKTGYLMTEKSNEPVYDLNKETAAETTKYFGWSVYRPTRSLTITVTLPQSASPINPRAEVMRASTFGFEGQRVEETEASRVQEEPTLTKLKSGEHVLALSVDFPVHGFIYQIVWDIR